MNFRLPEKALQTILRLGVYVFLALACYLLFGFVLQNLPMAIAAPLLVFCAAGVSNELAMRIYERRSLVDLGLVWNPSSIRNVLLGMAGGVVAALFVTLGPVLEGAAEITRVAGQPVDWAPSWCYSSFCCSGRWAKSCCCAGTGFRF